MKLCCVRKAQYSVLLLLALQYTIRQYLMVGGFAIFFQKLYFQVLVCFMKDFCIVSACFTWVRQYLAYSSWNCLLNKMLIESCVLHSSCTQPEESGTGLQMGSSFMSATENRESSGRKVLYTLKPINSTFGFLTFISLSGLPLHCKIGLL